MNADHTNDLMEHCPILYQGRGKSLRESLMPFGFECGDGWYYPLRSLSLRAEAINILMKPYGIYIEAMQVKEKFGTLRFYFNVRCKLPWYKTVWNNIISWIVYKLRPNRLAPISHFMFHGTDEQITLSEAVYDTMEEMVDACEDKCLGYCEECGAQIGSDEWNPRCETQGWISYLCQKCAKKRGGVYAIKNKDGKLRYYDGDKDITEEHVAEVEKWKANLKLRQNESKKTDENEAKEDDN